MKREQQCGGGGQNNGDLAMDAVHGVPLCMAPHPVCGVAGCTIENERTQSAPRHSGMHHGI